MIKKMLKKIKKIGIIKLLLIVNNIIMLDLLVINVFLNTKELIIKNIIFTLFLIFFYGFIGLIKE